MGGLAGAVYFISQTIDVYLSYPTTTTTRLHLVDQHDFPSNRIKIIIKKNFRRKYGWINPGKITICNLNRQFSHDHMKMPEFQNFSAFLVYMIRLVISLKSQHQIQIIKNSKGVPDANCSKTQGSCQEMPTDEHMWDFKG